MLPFFFHYLVIFPMYKHMNPTNPRSQPAPGLPRGSTGSLHSAARRGPAALRDPDIDSTPGICRAARRSDLAAVRGFLRDPAAARRTDGARPEPRRRCSGSVERRPRRPTEAGDRCTTRRSTATWRWQSCCWLRGRRWTGRTTAVGGLREQFRTAVARWKKKMRSGSFSVADFKHIER